jgi:hypothetical protein
MQDGRMKFTTRRASVIGVIGVVGLLCAGCHVGREEATRVVAAMDEYRAATGDVAVLAAAKRMQDVACTRADICHAKAACVEVSRPTAAAIELKLDVERQLGELAPNAAPANAAALTAKLHEATTMLATARAAVPLCVREGVELSARYGLTTAAGEPR